LAISTSSQFVKIWHIPEESDSSVSVTLLFFSILYRNFRKWPIVASAMPKRIPSVSDNLGNLMAKMWDLLIPALHIPEVRHGNNAVEGGPDS
jgi:hypothetical protein